MTASRLARAVPEPALSIEAAASVAGPRQHALGVLTRLTIEDVTEVLGTGWARAAHRLVPGGPNARLYATALTTGFIILEAAPLTEIVLGQARSAPWRRVPLTGWSGWRHADRRRVVRMALALRLTDTREGTRVALELRAVTRGAAGRAVLRALQPVLRRLARRPLEALLETVAVRLTASSPAIPPPATTATTTTRNAT